MYAYLSIPKSLRDGFSPTQIAVRSTEHAPALTNWWENCGLEKQAQFIDACGFKYDAIDMFMAKFADDAGYASTGPDLAAGGGIQPYDETKNPNMNLLDLLHQNPAYSQKRVRDVESAAEQAFNMNDTKFDQTSNFSTGTTAP